MGLSPLLLVLVVVVAALSEDRSLEARADLRRGSGGMSSSGSSGPAERLSHARRSARAQLHTANKNVNIAPAASPGHTRGVSRSCRTHGHRHSTTVTVRARASSAPAGPRTSYLPAHLRDGNHSVNHSIVYVPSLTHIFKIDPGVRFFITRR